MSLNYITDNGGALQAVVVPIEYWGIILENIRPSMRDDTSYLLASNTMKERLLAAKARMNEPAMSWEEVKRALDV